MKKTIKHPNGSEETIEGSAEELSEYERKLEESPNIKPKGKRRVLLNEENVRKIIQEEIDRDRLKFKPIFPYIPWFETPVKPWQETISFPKITWVDTNTQPCLVEQFFESNPNGICGISCPCLRCSPSYGVQPAMTMLKYKNMETNPSPIPFISAFQIVN